MRLELRGRTFQMDSYPCLRSVICDYNVVLLFFRQSAIHEYTPVPEN